MSLWQIHTPKKTIKFMWQHNMWLWTICALTGNHTSGFRWARWDKVEGRRWFTKYGIGAAGGGGGVLDGGWRGKERRMPRWSWGKRYRKTENKQHTYMPQWQHRGCKLQNKKGEPQQKQTHHTCATAQHPQQKQLQTPWVGHRQQQKQL